MAIGVAVLLMCSGCGGQTDEVASTDPNAPPTGPLTALSECSPLPTPSAEAPPGAQLPEGAVVTSTVVQGPLVNVTATVPRTPVVIRLAYEARDDLEILLSEDEVFESELLVSDGTHRTYIKASAICQTGSTLLAVVSPEGADEDALPVPGAAQGGQ